MDFQYIVSKELEKIEANTPALELWADLSQAFEQGGPGAVKELLAERIRGAKRRASREARAMTNAAGAVSKVRKKGRR